MNDETVPAGGVASAMTAAMKMDTPFPVTLTWEQWLAVSQYVEQAIDAVDANDGCPDPNAVRGMEIIDAECLKFENRLRKENGLPKRADYRRARVPDRVVPAVCSLVPEACCAKTWDGRTCDKPTGPSSQHYCEPHRRALVRIFRDRYKSVPE